MKTLERSLGLSGVVAISISSMLGSGIFVLPGLAFAYSGPSLWLAYLLSAICVLPAAMSKSELATAMPTSGGTYVYVERTFGPLAGTISGLGLWLSLLLKCAFALVGFSAYLSIFTDIAIENTALPLLFVIILLNLLGVGKVTGALIVIVSASTIGLVALSIGGIPNLNMNHFHPSMPNGIGGVLSAMAMVFVSFAGVTKIAAIAEEVKKPEKNLPKGILLSLLIVTIMYCSVSFILVGNLGSEQLLNNLKPIYTLANNNWGKYVGVVAALMAILTMTSMANAGILAASRFPFAMGRDNLMPSFLGRINARYLTPVWSIVYSGLIVGFSIIYLDVAKIAKLASSFIIINFMLVNLAVIVLRETRVQWYKPSYFSPLYPWLQIFGILSGLALLASMAGTAVMGIILIAVPGVSIYLSYGNFRTNRKGVIGIKGIVKDLNQVEEAIHQSKRIENIEFERSANVLVALFGKEKSSETLIEMGRALSKEEHLEVLHLMEVPEQANLNDFIEDNAHVRSLRRRIFAMREEHNIDITFDPVVAHDILKTTYDVSKKLKNKWLITEWAGKTSGAFTIHNPVGWLRDHLPCNIVSFRDAGVRYFKKILVLLDKTKNDHIALEAADQLGQAFGASLTLLRIVEEEGEDINMELEKVYLSQMKKNCQSPTLVKIMESRTKYKDLVALSAEYDLLIIAAPQRLSHKEKVFGTAYDRVTEEAACSVVFLQKGVESRSLKIFHKRY